MSNDIIEPATTDYVDPALNDITEPATIDNVDLVSNDAVEPIAMAMWWKYFI